MIACQSVPSVDVWLAGRPSADAATVRVLLDGLTPPIEEWQKAINDQLEKIRKLEETYDIELVRNKVPLPVNHLSVASLVIARSLSVLYQM